MIYYARVHDDPDGYWSELPDFDTVGSEGDSLEELRENSTEALTGLLEHLFFDNQEIPIPRKRRGPGWMALRVEDSVAIPIVLRQLRVSNKMTLKQTAEKLGIAYQSYQALETPGKANPTIKTLRKVAEVFDVSLWELIKDVS